MGVHTEILVCTLAIPSITCIKHHKSWVDSHWWLIICILWTLLLISLPYNGFSHIFFWILRIMPYLDPESVYHVDHWHEELHACIHQGFFSAHVAPSRAPSLSSVSWAWQDTVGAMQHTSQTFHSMWPLIRQDVHVLTVGGQCIKGEHRFWGERDPYLDPI